MENKEYIDIITDALNGDVEKVELVSQTSNIVFKVTTKQYGVVYAKFYLNKSSHIDNEMHLYSLMDQKYLKEVITSSESPKFAIFKELKGKTIDELTPEELSQNKEKIIDSLIYFYETIGGQKAEGFGLLDENMNGTSQSFQDFIVKRQSDTEEVLKDYPVLGTAFTEIYKKYKGSIAGDNSLVPIDTNAKNIMVTESGDIKFIDPGELISAPKLMGYGDFVAHTYKTELYEELMKKLNLSKEDEQRLRIYAVFSSLNILAFLKKIGVNDLDKVIPYGNKETFYSFIEEHLKALGIETQNLDVEER
ncbi:MAG: hypothetical protein IKE91_03515 [Clostridia bacterium]|nr:hypothetical protein [Clostridia bacterium]